MHLNGELLKCHLKGKSCRKWTVGLNINDSEKIDPGANLPLSRGNIRVYYSNIASETVWPVKAKFYIKHLQEGGTKYVYNKSRSHDQDGHHVHTR